VRAANREVIRQLVGSGEGQLEIDNRIAMMAESQTERQELREFVQLLRTARGEDINIFSGKSRLSQGYRPVNRPIQGQDQSERRHSPTRPIEKRGPGRPGWPADGDLFHQRLAEARAEAGPSASQGQLAALFRTLDGHRGIDPDSLARLLRRFGQ
jgi:hypothetical protein